MFCRHEPSPIQAEALAAKEAIVVSVCQAVSSDTISEIEKCCLVVVAERKKNPFNIPIGTVR